MSLRSILAIHVTELMEVIRAHSAPHNPQLQSSQLHDAVPLLWLLFISINLTFNLEWNTTAVMPGLVLLVAISSCQISYKDGFVGLLVFHLLPLLNSWLIIKMQPAKIFSTLIILVHVCLNCQNWFYFLISYYHSYMLQGCLCQHFFLHIARPLNSMSMECFSLFYDLGESGLVG